MTHDSPGKAFDFAQDTTKQLLTLSTGVITLTITFLKDVTKDAPHDSLGFLHAAWVLFLISIVSGVFVLMTLTGVVASEGAVATIYRGNVRLLSIVQILTFLLALAGVLVFGFKAM